MALLGGTEKRKDSNFRCYRTGLWNDKVAICIHTVRDYSESGKKAGCAITFNQTDSCWKFVEPDGAMAVAYRHRPVRKTREFPHESWSHCGVEFIRALSDLKLRQFARRLAKKKIRFIDV
jgi:hypothetical protein